MLVMNKSKWRFRQRPASLGVNVISTRGSLLKWQYDEYTGEYAEWIQSPSLPQPVPAGRDAKRRRGSLQSSDWKVRYNVWSDSRLSFLTYPVLSLLYTVRKNSSRSRRRRFGLEVGGLRAALNRLVCMLGIFWNYWYKC